METFWFVIVSVLIAAVIGGVTNHLAIKMLFYPRRAISIKGWKLPFTPGIIPKRKEEIGRSLGRVVGDYLVTSTGLKKQLTGRSFEQRLIDEMDRRLEQFLRRPGTIREWLFAYVDAHKLVEMEQNLMHMLSESVSASVGWLWEERNWKARMLGETIPGWSEQTKAQWSKHLASWVLDVITEELNTTSGDRLIRHLSMQFIEQAGGWLGALAGAFVDEHKLSAKVRSIALEQLRTPRVRGTIENMIQIKLSELEQLTLEQVVHAFAADKEEDGLQFVTRLVEKGMKSGWTASILDMPVAELEKPVSWIRHHLPGLTRNVLHFFGQHLDGLVRMLELEKLVENQVSEFPVDQLEKIVLSISGKEFRAITWLGAVLGGLIGLFQALFIQLYL